ncbi:MAG: DNA-binding MarR family transcriptional regulator [Saprospiraceae bacterium]|jgi:DNA-binding MarR family transcriptional regulator
MSALMVSHWVDFSALKEITGVTDGNLASHIKFLEKLEYITYEKIFLNKKPKTNYKATTKGKKAFRLHLKALEDILKL